MRNEVTSLTVYIDNEYKCHVSDSGTLTPIETDFFEGKCPAFVEGYRFVPGKMITPWRPYRELAAAQRQYEADRRLLEEAYKEGVNSLA